MSKASGVTRHPFRGSVSGLFLGLGLVVLVIVPGVVPFASITPFILIIVGAILLGLAIGLFGPKRATKR